MKNRFNALILCGGKGTRLGKIGKKIPKTLIKVGDEPMLNKIIKLVPKKICENTIISGNYLFSKIKTFINKNYNEDKIDLFNDGNISILNRIKKNLIRSKKNLIVFYGDEFANINFDKLIKSHIDSKKIITLTTYRYNSNFGFLFKKNNKFEFKEKPYLGNYNIGFMIFNYENIYYIKNYNKIENYLMKMCSLNNVNEYIHNGYHVTFNSISELEKAKENMKKFYA